MKYILKDYEAVGFDEPPMIWTFNNKDDVIAKLLEWCNVGAGYSYNVAVEYFEVEER